MITFFELSIKTGKTIENIDYLIISSFHGLVLPDACKSKLLLL